LSSQLGIEADASHQNNNRLQILYAIVIDVEKINAAGLFGSRKGDRVKILCTGKDTWRIKNYRNGISATITTTPPIN
jgi:hypothetical protein